LDRYAAFLLPIHLLSRIEPSHLITNSDQRWQTEVPEMHQTLQFESRKALAKRLQLSESSIKRMVKAGSLPKPVQLTKQRQAFVTSEVDERIAALIAARNAA
jgi:predicted DNA-binding transcriptional regulator AlpA